MTQLLVYIVMMMKYDVSMHDSDWLNFDQSENSYLINKN